VGFELTTLKVIGHDCIGSCKSNYHMITIMTAPVTSLNVEHWCKWIKNNVIHCSENKGTKNFFIAVLINVLVIILIFHGV
jgi:hypothetical protein